MQPTYLPWSGYFNLIKNVDYFVFLDDVQFNKRSWQQRNRILQNGEELILSVPVFTKNRSKQKIYEVIINDDINWKKQRLKSLEFSYQKSKYFSEIMPIIFEIYSFETISLAEFNINLIKIIAKALNIESKFILSKEINSSTHKSQHLLDICNSLKCDSYLSPTGSKDYIDSEALFEDNPIMIEYQKYNPKPYTQLNSGEFHSHLSIIDVLFNIGIENTKAYINDY